MSNSFSEKHDLTKANINILNSNNIQSKYETLIINIQQIFNIIIGQCSPGMEQALAAAKDYTKVREEADSVGLIKIIEQI